MALLWPEDKLQESSFFAMWIPGMELWVVRLGRRYLYLLIHLASPIITFNLNLNHAVEGLL